MHLKKADMALIGALMVVCLLLLIPLFNGSKTPATAVVQVKSDEVLRIDLSKDGNYSVEGTLGTVNIEVKDGAVAVTQENSPNHYCSKQGFVSSTNTPIVCLPNDTVITINDESADEAEDTVIS